MMFYQYFSSVSLQVGFDKVPVTILAVYVFDVHWSIS